MRNDHFAGVGKVIVIGRWRDRSDDAARENMMTKQDWETVEKSLSGTWGFVKLKVDGHNITFERRLVTKNRLGITTFVDGWFRGEWVLPKNEHSEQRFLHKEEKFAYPAKLRNDMKKLFGAKRFKAEKFDQKFSIFTPIWPSVTAIRRYYQKTFTSIELVEASYKPESTEA